MANLPSVWYSASQISDEFNNINSQLASYPDGSDLRSRVEEVSTTIAALQILWNTGSSKVKEQSAVEINLDQAASADKVLAVLDEIRSKTLTPYSTQSNSVTEGGD